MTAAVWSLRRYNTTGTGAVCEPMLTEEEFAIRSRIRQIIGWRIADARSHAKMSQEQLGIRIGAHRNSISRWESGEVDIDATTLYMLCCALDISPVAILRLITIAISATGIE